MTNQRDRQKGRPDMWKENIEIIVFFVLIIVIIVWKWKSTTK